MDKQLRYIVIGVTAVWLLAAYGLLFLLGSGAVDRYVREDGVVETIGAIGLLVAAFFFFLTFLRYRSHPEYGPVIKLALILLAIAFFFGAGEEISWGQRILGIETPTELESINAQNEINIHNIAILDRGLSVDRLFQLFWLLFGVLLPIAAVVSRQIREALGRFIPILPLWIAGLLIVNQIAAEITTIVQRADPGMYAGSFDFAQARFEVTEMMVAVIFAAGALSLHRRASRRQRGELQTEDAVQADDPAPTSAPTT